MAGRVVTPEGVIDPGYVQIRGDRIVAISAGPAPVGAGPAPAGDGPAPVGVVHRGAWVLPGFVDLHVHGGGGGSFASGDPASARAAAAFHLAHGTTTMLASLVSAPLDALVAAIRALVPLVREGILAGIHLEGPYLSPARCGAHDAACLGQPSPKEIAALLDAGAGTVAMVTIAPEVPGALTAIRQLAEAGVIAAIGHTDATYAQTVAAIEAGATVATHLFNAMPGLHHREPGPVAALLAAGTVTCELIADGGHLHDAAVRLAIAAAGPSRLALITDATAAAGMPDGEYDLGGRTVVASNGVVRLATAVGAGTRVGALAGSTLTMDAALRRTVDAGVSIVDAALMASTTPAARLGLPGTGALRQGSRADLVVLDHALAVVAVIRRGRDVTAPVAAS